MHKIDEKDSIEELPDIPLIDVGAPVPIVLANDRDLVGVPFAKFLLSFLFLAGGVSMDTISIPNLPHPLHWLNGPQSWDISPEGQLTITASAKTDWFIDPQGTVNVSNAPALLFSVESPCLLSARVAVEHVATYDAGVLMIYESPLAWAKLCLEFSPHGRPMIVSVVTKGISDDCNAFTVTGPMYLRISKLEKAYAFHVSENGAEWNLIRYFRLEDDTNAQMGFLAQSPTGEGCTASFSDIRFEEKLLADIRSGV